MTSHPGARRWRRGLIPVVSCGSGILLMLCWYYLIPPVVLPFNNVHGILLHKASHTIFVANDRYIGILRDGRVSNTSSSQTTRGAYVSPRVYTPSMPVMATHERLNYLLVARSLQEHGNENGKRDSEETADDDRTRASLEVRELKSLVCLKKTALEQKVVNGLSISQDGKWLAALGDRVCISQTSDYALTVSNYRLEADAICGEWGTKQNQLLVGMANGYVNALPAAGTVPSWSMKISDGPVTIVKCCESNNCFVFVAFAINDINKNAEPVIVFTEGMAPGGRTFTAKMPGSPIVGIFEMAFGIVTVDTNGAINNWTLRDDAEHYIWASQEMPSLDSKCVTACALADRPDHVICMGCGEVHTINISKERFDGFRASPPPRK
ncbi:MAG: hypothetical protein V4719_21415 [Planctomycetota bacterium]